MEKQDEKGEDRRVTKRERERERERERGESLRRSFVQLEIELCGIKVQIHRPDIRQEINNERAKVESIKDVST